MKLPKLATIIAQNGGEITNLSADFIEVLIQGRSFLIQEHLVYIKNSPHYIMKWFEYKDNQWISIRPLLELR